MAVEDKKQIEALSKLFSDGIKSGAEVLTQMLGADIRLEIPEVALLGPDDIKNEISKDEAFTVVEMAFNGRLNGNTGLFINETSAWKFVEQVAGDDAGSGEFDFISAGVLTEIGNIVLNRVMGAISNALSLNLDYVVPNFYQGDVARFWLPLSEDSSTMTGLVAHTRFEVSDLSTDGHIIVFFEKESYQSLIDKIENNQLDSPNLA